MSGIVERVAEALWHDRNPDMTWTEAGKRDFMGHARAAIEAMKKPTPEMEKAFELQGTKRFNFALMWGAAIDEALK